MVMKSKVWERGIVKGGKRRERKVRREEGSERERLLDATPEREREGE